VGRSTAERFDDIGIEFGGGESGSGGDVGEANQRVHQRQLPGMIELEAGYPPTVGE